MAMMLENRGPQAAINVTPMIDVLLVLLIIFMAIAPMRQHGLDALIPQTADQAHAKPPESPVVLEIRRDGSYALNSESIDTRQLTKRLTAVFAARGQRVLFVKAAGGLEFQTVATVIDRVREADVERVALMPRE